MPSLAYTVIAAPGLVMLAEADAMTFLISVAGVVTCIGTARMLFASLISLLLFLECYDKDIIAAQRCVCGDAHVYVIARRVARNSRGTYQTV